jgi:hypothetical protein
VAVAAVAVAFACARVFVVVLDDISVIRVDTVVGDFTDAGAGLRMTSTNAELLMF